MEAALGKKLAAVVAAAAGKYAGDASEEFIKDAWFQYAQQEAYQRATYGEGGMIYLP